MWMDLSVWILHHFGLAQGFCLSKSQKREADDLFLPFFFYILKIKIVLNFKGKTFF